MGEVLTGGAEIFLSQVNDLLVNHVVKYHLNVDPANFRVKQTILKVQRKSTTMYYKTKLDFVFSLDV